MSPNDVLNHTKMLINEAPCIEQALSNVIDFYFNSEVEGCPKVDDGDMLLFQFGGPYPWDENTSINLTRQFSFSDDEGEYSGMSQLQVNFTFDVSTYPMENGNFWCEDESAEQFKHKVLNCKVVEQVYKAPVIKTTVELGDV